MAQAEETDTRSHLMDLLRVRKGQMVDRGKVL
ncbi:hypothetical protein CCACVL1_23221 [Corchorus capsularis]|uniref:Uncharacterized protein n=1 Tax=Corchorus capsularis TaxID=210143 RepID=A0A1R3GUS3_COCAP|nr:hypothetical protein CCACVL1_23221 [Corchorus capsularis]